MKQFHILLVALLLFLSGCAARQPLQQSQTEGVLAWPPPPNPPRIEYVREIRTQEDAGINRGFWNKFKDFILGETESYMVKPYGVYSDAGGRIFIVDTERAAIHLMDVADNSYHLIGGEGTRQFIAPIGITGDDKGNLYVSDSAAGKLFVLSPPAYTPRSFSDLRLARPTGVAFNRRNGLLYVSDTASHQVVAFDAHGNEHSRLGRRGNKPGEFNFPTDLAIDRNGNLLVSDALNSRIQIFDAEAHLLHVFGSPGKEAGYLARPKGVAADSDNNIYVCDAQQDAVEIFNTDGALLMMFGETGSTRGNFWMPSGIYIDPNDVIYVSDTYNQRIQVFRYLKQNRFDDERELDAAAPVTKPGNAQTAPAAITDSLPGRSR